MKKIIILRETKPSKRISLMRCASAIICFALLVLGSTAFAAPPANDNFANATVISASPPATVSGNNIEATFESGEPNHSPSEAAGQKSVWWVWTPSASSTVIIDTGGSENVPPNDGLDTQLAVYTGATLAGVNLVTRNEDSTNFTGGRSAVTFSATAGTTYHIAVDGYAGETGNINLNFSSGTAITGVVLNVTTTGNGTVARTPAQPAGGYSSNAIVTVVATPSGTNAFLGWTGTDQSDTNRTNTVTMTSNKDITASFTTNSTPSSNTFRLSVLRSPSGSAGTVTRIPNKTLYQADEVVTVVAKPARSRSFLGWTGTAEGSTDLTNTVIMNADRTITATFSDLPGVVPSVFLPVVGTYNGLFFNTEVSTNCSGYFTIKVSKNGRFTVSLKKAGKTIVGRGQLTTNGVGTATLRSRGATNTVDIQLDITGVAPTIAGTVTTSDGCASTLEGDRVVFSSRNPSPIQGIYTFILPRNVTDGPQTNDVVTTNIVVVTNNPGTTNQLVVTNTTFLTNTIVSTNEIIINPGHSYASLVISKSGAARIRGALADGTKFSHTTTISTNGEIPLFASLYRGQGLLIGWLNVTSTDVSGAPINWKRPAGGLLFPNEIDADITVFGSKFDRTRNPFIALGTGGFLELSGNPGASTNESRAIELELINATTLKGTNGTLVKLLPSGLVRGNFKSLVTGKNTLLQGAMVQNDNGAFGYFLTTSRNSPNTSGAFELRPSTNTVAQGTVSLGAAAGFAVLAGSTVANTGTTQVTGDLGVSPGTAITGFPPGTVTGAIHTNDTAAAQAQTDLTTAFNDAAGRTVGAISKSGNLGGQTLAPGLYKSTSSLSISSGDLTLDAQGNSDAVWIFQIASTLTTSAGRQVILSGGAKASNVFWQVGSSATLGTTTVFKGTIMADQSITLNTGATLDGRALARIAAVTLDGNTVTIPAP